MFEQKETDLWGLPAIYYLNPWNSRHLICALDTDDIKQKNKNHETIPNKVVFCFTSSVSGNRLHNVNKRSMITPEAWAPVKLLIMWGSCIFVQFVIFVTPFGLTFVTVNGGNEWLLKEKSESAKKVYDRRMLWNFKLYKINILHSLIHS